MPASSSDNIYQIEETLKSSLSGGGDLDSDITLSSKRILLTQINNQDCGDAEHKKEHKMNGSGDVEDGFPVPKVVLYPEENVKLEWRKIQRIGAGLVNMGNTCFLNSTLQCLTYTAPLVNYCMSDEHNSSCKQAGFCMMCELQRHIKRCYENYGNAIKPQSILQKLRLIAKHMHWGRQEDAHEFLRYLVEALQKSCHNNLNGFAKLDKFSKETTVVNQIFGGFLRSQVQCLKCKERSNTYDPLLDISLDIKNVPTLEKAFEKYVLPEMLDNENAYMCTKCKQKVPAQKRFSVHKPPNVLTISFKRFDFHRMMGKITRHVNFPEKLNIRPYMSIRQGEPVQYSLYAVLVHSGVHCNSGHYYCYVKSPSQIWYCMNDSMVTQVSAARVLSSEAYLLFYSKVKPSVQKQKAHLIGPVQPNNHINSKFSTAVNGIKVHHSNDVGMLVQRKTTPVIKPHTSASSSISHISHDTKRPAASTPLPANREKVAFGIRPKQMIKPHDENTKEKPRIVMQIKNGKVTTYEKSPNGKSKLVPYDGESDSEDEIGPTKTNGPVPKVQSQMDKMKVENESSAKHRNGNSVIFDQKLNATTSVPGNQHLLETSQKESRANGGTKQKNNGHSLAINTNKDLMSDKKSMLEISSLSCVTTTKINATSNWHVLNQDLILSPSRGSNSSKESNNSTTEWQIKDSKDVPQFPKVPNYQHAGWKVTDGTNQSDSKNDHRHVAETSKDMKESNSSVSLKEVKVRDTFSDVRSDHNYQLASKDNLITSSNADPTEYSKKHKKKKRKHEKEHENKDYKHQESVSSSDTETQRKKHKKKKHKHKKDKEEEDFSEKKKKRHGDDEDKKRHHDDSKKRKLDTESDDSTELVWVEKTKDSLTSKTSQSAPVQSWDHHVKDGYKRQKNGSHSKPTWDGSKNSSVAETLEKTASLHSFGPSVLSWDGGKSTLDREVEKDKERKRHWSDDYDEEIDTGKVKKVKQHYSDTALHGSNVFQYVQDERNKDNSKHFSGNHSFGQSHSYHNHQHHHHSGHKGHHNSYRGNQGHRDYRKHNSGQKY
ncbi:USP36_42 [Mytilus coruscus]|uniref:Ubiquitin carboxyl-terminal hydrolase 36 n=1 Tax=Mytilus coruscus TaxID=42192 RepID=A0A6J8DDL8_MYTCO|nr:USP36_42 [Mytilus coruscus]